MLTAAKVANYFIDKSQTEELCDLDHLKLQKLCYYAYGWAFPNNLGPLFGEDIEAWPHGPVVRELYLHFREFGRRVIKDYAKDLIRNSDGRIDVSVPKMNQTEIDKYGPLLDEVWNTYKNFTGIQLSNSTHEPDSPWDLVRKTLGLQKHRIPDGFIKEYFCNQAEQLEQ